MLAAAPTSVLGSILPTAAAAAPDLALLREPTQQPTPEDPRTQAEATERLLMPMNGQGSSKMDQSSRDPNAPTIPKRIDYDELRCISRD